MEEIAVEQHQDAGEWWGWPLIMRRLKACPESVRLRIVCGLAGVLYMYMRAATLFVCESSVSRF